MGIRFSKFVNVENKGNVFVVPDLIEYILAFIFGKRFVNIVITSKETQVWVQKCSEYKNTLYILSETIYTFK